MNHLDAVSNTILFSHSAKIVLPILGWPYAWFLDTLFLGHAAGSRAANRSDPAVVVDTSLSLCHFRFRHRQTPNLSYSSTDR